MNKLAEPRVVNVGDNTYYIRPLPAFRAANLTGELSALVMPLLSGFAPLIGAVDTDSDKSILDVDINDPSIVTAIATAFSSISGDKVEAILKHLLITGKNIAVETPDSADPKILTEDLANEMFCTDVQDMFVLAYEVIRTNYNGFFEKLAARFGPLAEVLTKAAQPKQQSMAASTIQLSATSN